MQLYINRNQLKKLEDEGEGKINWDVWDRLVEQTKIDIEIAISKRKEYNEARQLKRKRVKKDKKPIRKRELKKLLTKDDEQILLDSLNNKDIKLYLYNPNGELIGVYNTFYQYGKENYYNFYSNLKIRLANYGDIITKGNLLSYSEYNQEQAKEIYEKKFRNNR